MTLNNSTPSAPEIQVLHNCSLAGTAAGFELVENATIILHGARIAYAGPTAAAPATADASRVDLGGRLVTPAPIDCHTHIVHGGNRAREFEMRLEGASYLDIAKAGGGIVSTVRATRAAAHEHPRVTGHVTGYVGGQDRQGQARTGQASDNPGTSQPQSVSEPVDPGASWPTRIPGSENAWSHDREESA